ncbi:MAG: hypothetical protein BWY31_01193 [Lentisphaerae bacterium ADurb.Bin242]|nr:MAG: hypothetical protein BWY31_01193 [Lentisphaerae bacterium ADurb.Bin242]
MGKILLDHQKLLWHKERLKSWLAGERIAPGPEPMHVNCI